MLVTGRCQWRMDENASGRGCHQRPLDQRLHTDWTQLNAALRCGLNSTVLVDSNSRVQLPSLMQDGDVLKTIVTINRGRATSRSIASV